MDTCFKYEVFKLMIIDMPGEALMKEIRFEKIAILIVVNNLFNRSTHNFLTIIYELLFFLSNTPIQKDLFLNIV